jgi:HEAT repeat protein
LLVLLFPISLPFIAQTARIQNQDDNSHILTDAIKGFASDDEAERRTARATLLGMGQAAIPPLLSLLQSLMPTIEVCPPDSNLPCRTGFISVSTPKTRLRSEVIALLGQLRAVTAVPFLIKLLGLYDSEGAGIRYWGPERDALIEIGSLAIPELLESLRQAEEKRQTIRMDDRSVAPYLEIEIRILDVLGRISDDRALDLLIKLKESNPNPYFQSSLKEAEDRIKEKAR